jgi:hypothetical protein
MGYNKKLRIQPQTLTLTCGCGKQFERDIYRYNYNKRNNIQNCCSGGCALTLRSRKRADDFVIYDSVCRFRAKRHGMKFNLTPTYLRKLWNKQGGKCAYTGAELIHKRWKRGYDKSSAMLRGASVDKIDPLKGYIKGNVQFVGIGINFAKSDFSDHDTKEFINFIMTKTPEKNYVKSGFVRRIEELIPIG